MKNVWLKLLIPGLFGMSVLAETETQFFNFNDFDDRPIDGQMEWNVYEKVKDSSALSVMDVLGTSGDDGDKALVLRPSPHSAIRCVTGEPVRWLPGGTLTMEFDFKVAIGPIDISMPRPVMTVLIGNSLLSGKASWQVQLAASPTGDWVLIGAMPDGSSKRIYAENFLIRADNEVSISQWCKFRMVATKLDDPDSFQMSVEISTAESDEELAMITFSDNKKDKVTRTMWNTSRAHVGFLASKEQVGVVCVDNLDITSTND